MSLTRSMPALRASRSSRRNKALALGLTMVSLAVLAGGCSSRKTAANPLSPTAYLDHALTVMRANAVYTPTAGWPAVIKEARTMAAGAKTAVDTYGAINYAIGQLQQAGDLHAVFTNAFTAKVQAQAAATPGGSSPPPTVSRVDDRVGLIDLPGVKTLPTRNARRYAARALAAVASLQARDHPCGWIVDVRNNTGGDMYPMLLSVGPILGNGRLIGFTGGKVSDSFVSYSDGTLSGGGHIARAPVKVPNIAPAPAVAVLTNSMTFSSGEAVTIAFRGRLHTRSFGTSTGGATNSPQIYRLADGATVRVSVVWDIDRRGIVYRNPIKPEVAFPDSASPRSVEQAAEKWLLSTAACARTH
jgi:carboxyl-terminal processing protease